MRLALIACLTLSLLGSMLHCAKYDDTIVLSTMFAQTLQHDTAPADQALPCHSGHCLSHIIPDTAEPRIAMAAFLMEAPQFAQDRATTAIAGLPLFKPPRA
jgi:hypothetical protein